jgi:hypothetical protein
LERAAVVVLRAGDTPSFWWELERVVRLVPPERVVLLCPSDQAAWSRLAGKASKILPRPLPHSLPDLPLPTGHVLIYFGSDWTPRAGVFKSSWLRSSLTRPLVAQYKWALRPLFNQLHVPWTVPGVDGWRVAILIFFLICVVGPLLGLMLS